MSKNKKKHNTVEDDAFIKKSKVVDKDSVDSESLNSQHEDKAFTPNTTAGLSLSEESSNDKTLRLQADFDNFRKRSAKERIDLIRYGNQGLITDLLQVLNNFDLAIKSMHSEENVQNVVQGVNMIQNQLMQVLKDKGVERMKTKGESFDPHSHEAVSFEDTLEKEQDNIILEELQAGYKLYEKIIQVPKVKISKYKSGQDDDAKS